MTEGAPPFDSWHPPDPEPDDERISRKQLEYIREHGLGGLFGVKDE